MSTLAQWREKLAYQPLSLGIVAMLTAAALAIGNHVTYDSILKAEERDLQLSLAEVLPAGYADNDLLSDSVKIAGGNGQPVVIYRARKAGKVKGAVFRVAGRGYAGEISVLIGIDDSGRMLGTRVLSHRETPGLGDKIEAAKSNWIRAFDGKSLADQPAEQWAVKKDGGMFDQFAGATITPRGIVTAVKGGLEFFAAHRNEILEGG